jgi:hypothetical protein
MYRILGCLSLTVVGSSSAFSPPPCVTRAVDQEFRSVEAHAEKEVCGERENG